MEHSQPCATKYAQGNIQDIRKRGHKIYVKNANSLSLNLMQDTV